MWSVKMDNRGTVAVEFALITPVLLMLVIGMAQVSMAFFTYNNMINTARDLSRQLVIGNVSSAQAQSWANNRLPAFVDFAVTVTAPDPADPTSMFVIGVTAPMDQVVIVDPIGLFNGRTLAVEVVGTPQTDDS